MATMTIAACYLSPEGVVFASDSTTTLRIAGPGGTNTPEERFLDFGQKIFELGDDSTFGILTWGLGGFPQTSYRTLYAEFADDLRSNAPTSVEDAAKRWAAKFFSVYDSLIGSVYRAAVEAATTQDEKDKVEALARGQVVGFCLGGYAPPNRRPAAYEIVFSPDGTDVPAPEALPVGRAIFQGIPVLINRMMFGIDPDLFENIAASKNWTGERADLLALVQPFMLGQPPMLPLREAIDWLHSCIQSTIKGMKFSPLAPMCGGPIEIAVVTSDRPFRWVRHKNLDAAICDGSTETHREAR
jgi:hypothetical protein